MSSIMKAEAVSFFNMFLPVYQDTWCHIPQVHNLHPCSCENHISRLLTGEKPYQCTVCGRCFRNNYMLKVHMRLHTGEKNFKCKECGALFTERGALVSHLRTHTGVKPFVCSFCGCKFAQNPALKRHLRIHTKVCTVYNRASSVFSDVTLCSMVDMD